MKWLRCRRRTLLGTLLVLAGGAVINVAVAWGCVLWCDTVVDEEDIGFPSDSDAWLSTLGVDPTSYSTATVPAAEESNRLRRAPPPAPAPVEIAEPGDPPTFRLRGAKDWRPIERLIDQPMNRKDSLIQTRMIWLGHDRLQVFHVSGPWNALLIPGESAFAVRDHAGFPMPCLQADAVAMNADASGPAIPTLISDASAYNVRHGARISRQLTSSRLAWPGIDSPPPALLPLLSIWPGFAINTVFYAAMLWLLFAAPFAIRRRRRVKRGLCPACAYPVGASDVCTECGKPVLTRPARGDGM